MTCIAAIVKDGKVWMGGDSAGVDTDSLELQHRVDPKVFKVGGFMIGFTTSFRMGQLLHHAFEPPSMSYNDTNISRFMVRDFVPAVQQCLEAGGYQICKDEALEGGTFLVAYRGRLFYVEDDYQVGEIRDGYHAVGCGGRFAIGAFHALRKSRFSPQSKVMSALEAAAHHSAGVTGPFLVLEQ